MISVPTFVSAIREAIAAEQRALEGASLQVRELPSNVFLQAIRKRLWQQKKDIFNERRMEYLPEHPFKLNPQSLLFRAGSGNKDAVYLLFDFGLISTQEDFEASVKRYFEHSYKNCRAFYGSLLFCSHDEVEEWSGRNETELLGLLTITAGPVPLYEPKNPDDKVLWLIIWEIKVQEIIHPEASDMANAMKLAVDNMKYENMLAMIRKIISLRTHIPEEKIDEESSLTHLYKVAFAMEQGVGIEEVYDPEAFQGYTDSQLASRNLVNDLQKTFCITLSPDEELKIHTLRDLANVLVKKTS